MRHIWIFNPTDFQLFFKKPWNIYNNHKDPNIFVQKEK